MANMYPSKLQSGSNGREPVETVLWTNPSPTATFAPQSVTLNDDVSNYDAIRIYLNSTEYIEMQSGLNGTHNSNFKL